MKNTNRNFKRNTKIYVTIAALLACLLATGCSSVSLNNTADPVETYSGESVIAASTNYTGAAEEGETTATNTSAEVTAESVFTSRDLEQTADLTDASYITVSDGETVDITEEGVYVISGSAKNCTIKVTADSSAKIQLVLDGVEITNENFPAIYVVSADKVFITTTDSVNTLSVTGAFTADGTTNTDAVIFAKDDIVLNGVGELNITSTYGNGISCKDDLKITGGTINVTSKLDSIEANDSVLIGGGVINIDSGKDGIHSEDSDDNTVGCVYISGGELNITAADDGIQGTTFVQVDGGSITVNAQEGIEGTYVQINDGTINITATDDGINAAAKSSAYSVVIEFNGGYTTISMGQGDTDAVDANGSIYVNGGTIDVTAPTSSFDYDNKAEFNGGTIIINGQEVDEIPEDMMGGRGGFGGGNMGGNFGGRGMQA